MFRVFLFRVKSLGLGFGVNGFLVEGLGFPV